MVHWDSQFCVVLGIVGKLDVTVLATNNIQGRPRVYVYMGMLYSSGLHSIVMNKGNQSA